MIYSPLAYFFSFAQVLLISKQCLRALFFKLSTKNIENLIASYRESKQIRAKKSTQYKKQHVSVPTTLVLVSSWWGGAHLLCL